MANDGLMIILLVKFYWNIAKHTIYILSTGAFYCNTDLSVTMDYQSLTHLLSVSVQKNYSKQHDHLHMINNNKKLLMKTML